MRSRIANCCGERVECVFDQGVVGELTTIEQPLLACGE
jgi:hypothetical protein